MKKLAVLLAAASMMVGMAVSAQAYTLSLNLSDGTNNVLVVDNSADDLNPLVGSISYLDTTGLGVWSNFEVNSGTSKPNLNNSDYLALMDLHFNGTSTGAGTFTLTLTDSDFNLITPVTSPNSVASLEIGGTSNALGSVTYNAYYNTTQLLGSTTDITSPFASSASSFLDTSNPFSLTEVVQITHAKGGLTTGDAYLTVTPVPEPGTMVLLGAGLLGLAIYGKRRMNKEA